MHRILSVVLKLVIFAGVTAGLSPLNQVLAEQIAIPAAPKNMVVASAQNSKSEWYCRAGSCRGDDGKDYSCGYVLCSESVDTCGCSCVSVSDAPYPKGYCGSESPYSAVSSSPQVRRRGAYPFSLN
jgi:hypothetical protein